MKAPSPAFSFYPKDILSDEACCAMTHAELGAAFTRLVRAVQDGDRSIIGELPEVLTRKIRWPAAYPRRPHIPLDVRRAVYERDGFACVFCGAFEPLSLDHIQPFSKGGADTVDNLRTLCLPCNIERGAGE